MELHQANVTSYDTSFDLRLKGTLRSTLTASALSEGSQTSTTPAPASIFTDEAEAASTPAEAASGDSVTPQPQIEPNRAGSAATAAWVAELRRFWQSELAKRRNAAARRRWRECLAIGVERRLRGAKATTSWPRRRICPRGVRRHTPSTWRTPSNSLVSRIGATMAAFYRCEAAELACQWKEDWPIKVRPPFPECRTFPSRVAIPKVNESFQWN